MRERKILIVEDDDDIRAQVTRALKIEDYRVRSCTNGKEALDYLLSCSEAELPACVILDLMMPVMDGNTFMRVLGEKYASLKNKLKIIVATAKGSSTNPEALPFAVERIQKPFDLDELHRVLSNHYG